MPKPIKLTQKLKEDAIKEFAEAIEKAKMSDGKVSYSKSFTYAEQEKAVIYYTAKAYAKMIALVQHCSKEVAWHGCGRRLEAESGAAFLIEDILVYPQTVSGATVDMDQLGYATWMMENDADERFRNIIMQGHSHVNMGTSPSSTDIEHQERILARLTDDMYYIFQIWNKRMECTSKIFDIEQNTLYENADIEVKLYDENDSIEEFLEEADKMVKEPAKAATSDSTATKSSVKTGFTSDYPPPYYGFESGYGYYGDYDDLFSYGKHGKKDDKGKNGGNWHGRGKKYMDDKADDIFKK